MTDSDDAQSSESVDRVSGPSQSSESYGRTDGRTDGEPTHLGRTNLPFGYAREKAQPEISLAELIDEFADAIERARGRHPIKRTGERDPIPKWLRRAIHRRDGWECLFCGMGPFTQGYDGSPLQLDHIQPWSAGGSDRSDNLRTLCEPCNTDRSNYRIDDRARVLPIGYCDECFRTWWAGRPGDDEPIIAFCYRCKHPRPVTDRSRLW